MDGTRRPPLIVVGVDESHSARHAAEWAAEPASARNAALELVHVVPDDAEKTAYPEWLRELHNAVVSSGVDQVDTRVLPGRTAGELIGRSHRAGMVVVGSFGESSRSGMQAGSVALALVEEAGCPVAVVRGSTPGLPPPRAGSVLVGTDAASADDPALCVGADVADALGCRLSVLHACSDIVEDASGLHRVAHSGTELVAAAVEQLETCLQPVRDAFPALAVERHVVDDTALRALLAGATDARMVVVAHHRGSLDRRRLGSTSRGLVAFASCPVVVT